MVVVIRMNGNVIDKDFYTIDRIKEMQSISGITIEIA